MSEVTCAICTNPFERTGPRSKYCPSCLPDHVRKISRENMMKYRTAKGCKTGVGKGGANAKGKDDGQYKTGIGAFHKGSKAFKDKVRFCQRCPKDLLDAGRYEWCVHHKDHDRTNNVESNYELLCKSCHQKEHNCHLAFTVRNDQRDDPRVGPKRARNAENLTE